MPFFFSSADVTESGQETCRWTGCKTHLEVLQGELQHVTEDITEDLRLPLHQHIFIVQRLDHLWFHLEDTEEELCYRAVCCKSLTKVILKHNF